MENKLLGRDVGVELDEGMPREFYLWFALLTALPPNRLCVQPLIFEKESNCFIVGEMILYA
jgi:hypothetical protein